ncbi:hypothetical protein L7F22_058938 [Adiantum nelumboides]|nr:hypothetical protein [Adiantum nelumboides]
METKEKHEHKGKNEPQNSSKGNSSNNKAKEKGIYKERIGSLLKRNARNEQPRASIIEAPKEDVHCKGSPLSYSWGKVREHDAFILFDPGSTHNFISHELAAKLGIQELEMGDAMKADGAFIGQDASVTPLIGKLRLHIQGYVDKEDVFISPLIHEDVILEAPWFDRLVASIKFPERRISFKFREKNMYIDAQDSGNTIPLVHTHAFDKSIKSSIFVYMIFVKDSLSDVNKTQVNESGSQEDLELSKFLNQFQDVFIDDIPGELPPKRVFDDHAIELIPGSSPPNKPPYRVSQAQQEEIMRQVNELVEKGMVRPSSSPFCSPVLLVHKKDGTYCMCVDYRALNKITIKNRFPVPRIEDLFDKLQGSTYFNRIDLKSGYHQIRIVNEDILKTVFHTTIGLYEYIVMPFGLTNALATFSHMMEWIFQPHRNFTRVFFDDVIIYSKSMEEHKKHLQNAGAASVLVADDQDEPLITMDSLEEDGKAAEYVQKITIPSALIEKAFGDRLKAKLAKKETISVKLDWSESLPHPDEQVEYKLWTSSTNKCGAKCDALAEFIQSFKEFSKNGATQSSLLIISRGYARRRNPTIRVGETFEQLVNAHQDALTIVSFGETTQTNDGLEVVNPIQRKLSRRKSSHGNNQEEVVQLVQDEKIETGAMGLKSYKAYIRFLKAVTLFIFMTLWQIIFVVLQALSNFWLANEVSNTIISEGVLVGIYAALLVASGVFVHLKSEFNVWLGLKASKEFFLGMLRTLFRAPMSFFDSTPTERIISRVSTVLSILDLDIPFYVGFVIAGSLELLGILVVIAA